MPLPTKTLREVAAEIGIPEAELRAMVDMNKVRAVFKKGQFLIAPDEVAKIKRLRKTLPESSTKAQAMEAPAPIAKPQPPRPGAPRPPTPAKAPPPPRSFGE